MPSASIDNLTDPALEQLESLQERVTSLTARLEHAERLATLGTIAGLIAHEFNNILTPVMSYAQLALANGEDADLTMKALQKAADGADQASQIAAAILGFVRTEQGGESGADVREAVETALACIGRDLDKDRIELTLDVPRGTEAAIRPVALRHILVNLILNARNAMLPRGGSLTIRVTNRAEPPAPPADAAVAIGGSRDPDGFESAMSIGAARKLCQDGCIVLEVTDTGRGIDADRLDRIFQPYETSSSSIRGPDQVGGTGLGLATCERLVTETGGFLWVESEPGRGTTVGVALPAAQADRTEHQTRRLVA